MSVESYPRYDCSLQARPCGWDWALQTCLDLLAVRALAHLDSLQASLVLMADGEGAVSACWTDTLPAKSDADQYLLQPLGKCRFTMLEVTLLWLVSDSIELGPGSSQTKNEALGDRLKLWQPGACSYNFKPNFWLMLDVWTWAMQLASCCLNQLDWMIESWLDLPESRGEVWSDLSRINKNKYAYCLQTQHISVSL